MKLRPTSLPLQILVFVVLPLLALLMLVAVGGVALHQTAMRDMLVDHNDQVVAGTAVSLSDQIAQREAILSQIALPDHADAMQEMLAGAAWLPTLFDSGVAVYAADGQRLAASGSGDWDGLDAQISDPAAPPLLSLISPGDNATRIAITVVQGERRLVGIVSLAALPIREVLMSLHESASTDVYLLDARGMVLYHSNPALVGEEFDAAPASTEPVEHTNHEGRDVVATVAAVPGIGWTLVQEERWTETLSPVMRYSQAAPLALVPGLLIAMGAMWFGIRRIVIPLRRLEGEATALAGGDFAAIEQQVGGISEIQHLQATLQHMAKRVQAAQVSMHDYIGAITSAQEDERRRLARELHDQTAQALVALGHRQQMLKPHLTDDPTAAELHAEIRRMIQDTIEDLRRIVRALRPVYLEELGLVPALQMLTRDLGPHDSMTVHFDKTGTPRRLAPEHEIALYRIAQEALNNAWQHSDATQIWLRVHFEAAQVTLSVRDNGRGFSVVHQMPDPASSIKHFGLMGMRERAALIGAQIKIESEPGVGTTITILAPTLTNLESQALR
ncbi:ATP-binding protein [Aggregatilinea sp.]|jgi:signal transduction histidine kinase|uniref:ATP-binding protein n=1 Tax=Aggregatilinea sp. TaxID=2806333 RepID=UPI002D1FA1E2|nr:ATP-binding protein [Aggregatilinea sp.]